MAIAGNQSMFDGIKGKFGRKAVFRQLRGMTVVASPPSPARFTTEAQIATRSKFKRAAAYSKMQMRNPEMKLRYKAKINNKRHTAYLVGIADYMNSPVISEIYTRNYTGDPGQVVSVKASDDFEVQCVIITISNELGEILEQGVASFEGSDTWIYHTRIKNENKVACVMAEARDWAGNAVTRQVHCENGPFKKPIIVTESSTNVPTVSMRQMPPPPLHWTRIAASPSKAH